MLLLLCVRVRSCNLSCTSVCAGRASEAVRWLHNWHDGPVLLLVCVHKLYAQLAQRSTAHHKCSTAQPPYR